MQEADHSLNSEAIGNQSEFLVSSHRFERRIEELERELAASMRASEEARAEKKLLAGAFESLSDGFALFDSGDKLIFCNKMFKELNPDLASSVRPGVTFEDLLRDNIKHGRILDAVGCEEAFVRERMERHRNPGQPVLSARRDGRWLLMREERAPDGCTFLVNTDLTELKRREEALRKSEERLRAVFDNVPVAFFLKDTNGQYKFINSRYADWFEIDAATVEGKTVYDMFAEERADRYNAGDQQIIRTLSTVTDEVDIPLPSGQTKSFILTKFPILSNGKLTDIGGVMIDVTKRKQTEVAFEESEKRLRDFAESTADWFWEMDENLRYTWFSSNFGEASGVSPEWLYGKTRQEIGAPGVPSEQWLEHLGTLEQRKPYKDFEFLRRGPDGDKWMRSAGIPVFDSGGRFSGYRGTGSDITREKNAMLTANKAKTLLATAIESLNELFVLWGPDDRLVVCNERFRRINEKVKETTQPGTLFADHIRAALKHGLYPEANGREEDWYQERIAQHENPQEPFELARQDGVWILTQEQKFLDGSTATIALDITERKRVEEERNKALELAEWANKAKSDFLASMSHDLRTPLNAVLGFSEILKEEILGRHAVAKYKEYAKDIHSSASYLLELINDLLDLSAIESGKRDLEKEALSLHEIVTDCTRMCHEKACSKDIKVVVNLPVDLPVLFADKRALKQILLNLVTNALKFTPAGGQVTIEANASKNCTSILVSDTGVGIASGRTLDIINPYVRDPLDPNEKEKGWGLGLPIVQALVDFHGGNLDIDSELGNGTRVTVSIPHG